jgi:phosphate-selective porin OprO/OprP
MCYNPLWAQEQEGAAGFDHGFFIRSADGAFVFRPFGLIHTDLRIVNSGTQINVDDTQASTFLVRRLRLGFEGQLYKWIDYDLETNVGAGGAELIFAWMNFGYAQGAQVRIGQFKEPFSYEVLLPEKNLDFIERSIVATVISPAEDIGVMVHNFGAPLGGLFEYGIGMFNGIGASAEKKDPHKSFEYVGRIALYPFALSSNAWLKNLRVAGYALYENDRPEGVDIRPRTPFGFEFFPRIPTKGERLALGGDLRWVHGPFSAKAEYIRNAEKRVAPSLSQFSNLEAITEGWHVDLTYLVTGEDKKLALDC